jgi:hypothetical protein
METVKKVLKVLCEYIQFFALMLWLFVKASLSFLIVFPYHIFESLIYVPYLILIKGYKVKRHKKSYYDWGTLMIEDPKNPVDHSLRDDIRRHTAMEKAQKEKEEKILITKEKIKDFFLKYTK